MRELARELTELEQLNADKKYYEFTFEADEIDIWNEQVVGDIVVSGLDEDEGHILSTVFDMISDLHNVTYYSWTYMQDKCDSDKYYYRFHVHVEM